MGNVDRYRAVRALGAELGVDALAFVPGPNFTRLMGQQFGTNERPLVIVVPVTGPPAAVVPHLELRSFDLVEFEGEVFDWKDQNGYQSAFNSLLGHLTIDSLGVEGQVMRVFVHHALMAARPRLLIVDAEKEISGLRICKSAAEIAALERAIRTSETALAVILDDVRVGMSEVDIRRLLIRALFDNGADDLSFQPIVAAGDNSARPHATSRADYAIRDGDALLIDFGARVDGFCADITRTVFVGHADDEAVRVYETVARANRLGREMTRPGITAHQVDDAVTTLLEESEFAARIRTRTGHGLGRQVHEAPYIVRGNHQVLEPGMVFTVEPGLYRIGGFGVRIEDDVLVTDDGGWSLTTFDRELKIVC